MTGSAVQVLPVSRRRDLRDFVNLPFRIYQDDPNWVPPLKMEVRWMLSEKKNPFWQHASRKLFLARREGRTVGRIAAIVDSSHNKVHKDRTAFFGFFECENDPEAARALLDEAERAAREMYPECDKLRGPLNPSMNDEVGALVPEESDPGMPFLMMTYNPAYYLELFAGAGFVKEKDVVAILAPCSDISFPRLSRICAAVQRREKSLTVRQIRMDRFPEELALVQQIYNKAWERNWGFVPMTPAEIDAMAKKLKDLIEPGYIWFAEMDGQPAAFLMGFPDYNQVFAKMGGRLLPFGWLTFLRERKKIDRVRCMALGIVPEFRKKGLDAILYYLSMQEGVKRNQKWVEFSWMLEDNLDILRGLEVFQGRIYRRYRLLSRQVPESR